MVIRFNTQNTINHIQDERMQLAGNDYIEVSSHIGARPLYSQDQGKIFSLSGNTEPTQDGSGLEIIPKPRSSSTFGEPAGIFGINCGHSRYAFVPSLSYKREMDFTKKENDEVYIEKQQQRLYERTIRNKKREIAMLKEIGAEDGYIKKRTEQLSDYRDEYLKFLDKTGRTRVSGNEWIGNNKKKTSSDDIYNSIVNESNIKLYENYSMYGELDTFAKFQKIKYNNPEKWKEYQYYNKVITGARNNSAKTTKTKEKHAKIFYEAVRKRSGDAERISTNTGYSKEDIESIRQYLFFEKHNLSTGYKRFDEDYDIAVSWQRLNDGKDIKPHDIILLQHELLEQKYISQGYSQEEAHKLASEKHNYQKELNKYDNSKKYKN